VKTPGEYARFSQLARQLATEIKPDPADPAAPQINEAIVYLNLAARKLQTAAEFKAEKEKSSAAG
jgi:hypothetical protein